jgi:oligopeptide transport system substrate-binding protein
LAGCGSSERADLVIHNGPEPETIDPQILTGQADGRIASALFEGLTRFNPTNGTAMPGLASHWEISRDGLAYTFFLRPEARWSTGEAIEADEVVWSWRRVVTPATAADYSSQFFCVRNGRALVNGELRDPALLGAEALDARTVRVHLENPTPYFLELVASRVFFPIPRRAVERLGDQWIRAAPLPCSGPYQLLGWRVNDRFRLSRNPRYWDAPRVDAERIDILSGDNPSTALNLFLSGEVDLISDRKIIPGELAPELARRPDFHRFDYLGQDFIRFNTTRKPFQDARVRRALALAIDRERITTRITRMGERPSAAITPAGTGGYQPPSGLPFDPPAARRLLAEAGYPGGSGFPTVEYAFNVGSRIYEQTGVEIQAMLKEHLGIRIELRPLEWKTYLAEMSALNYDVIRGSWIGDYDDPMTFLDCFLSDSGNNRTGWKDARYDRLLRAATSEGDPRRRAGILREAETLLIAEAVPVTGLYSHVGLYAADPRRVTGVWPNRMDEHPFFSMRRIRP